MATALNVKREPAEHTDIENKILRLCEENAKGLLITMLQSEMPEYKAEELIGVVNNLLKAKKLGMTQRAKQQFIVRLDPQQSAAATTSKKATGLSDHDEKLVYQIIECSGNKGIWEKDIRVRSKLALLSTTKILKTLESKKLIKSVKSVAANRKKMYMLYGLEPDVSVTGGTWYSGQTFDSEFVQLITDYCLVCLQKKAESAATLLREMKLDLIAHRRASFATSTEILQFITSLAVSKVALSVSDIEAVMDALVYDCRVEKDISVGASSSTGTGTSREQINSYRVVSPLIQPTGLMRMPCGLCPVIDECHEGGAISPSTCRYMQEWLENKLDF